MSTKNIHISYIAVLLTLLLISAGTLHAQTIFHPNDSIQQQYQKIKDIRENLDQTVWAQEVLAQEYEKVFVKFWDDLRNSEDKYDIFNNFTFEEIILKEPGVKRNYEGEIEGTQFSGSQRVYTFKEWKEFLQKRKDEGYRVIQSEWHHRDFQKISEGNIQSVFRVVLHVENMRLKSRIIIEGDINVRWSRNKNDMGHVTPAVIRGENLSMLTRTLDGSIFEEIHIMNKPGQRPYAGPDAPILVYDLNKDGYAEIIMPDTNVLFWNMQNGRFEESTIFDAPPRGVAGALIADVTADNMPDLILGMFHNYPLIYEGTPSGRFSQTPREILIDDGPLSIPLSLNVGDIDRDGDLDLWIGQYKPPYFSGQMPTPYYDANDGFPSYMLENLGHGEFKDITKQAGLDQKRYRRTYSSSFIDFDNDKDLDLIVVSDFSGVDVYFNDGAGRFTDVTSRVIDESANFGMAHTFGDFNSDGQIDFYVTGMSSSTARRLSNMGLGREEFKDYQAKRLPMGYGNRMYLGRGDEGVFEQFMFKNQVNSSGWSWGTTSFDFDNDGDQDIYVGNGYLSHKTAKDYCTKFWRHDIYSGNSLPSQALNLIYEENLGKLTLQEYSWNGFEHNHLYLNIKGREFINTAFLFELAFEFDTRVVISEDLDLDGKIDLIISDREGQVYVLKNNWPKDEPWIGVVLNPTERISAFGSKIIIHQKNARKQIPVVSGESFLAQHSFSKHVGLGQSSKVEMIEVQWPDGSITKLKSPALRKYHHIHPPKRNLPE